MLFRVIKLSCDRLVILLSFIAIAFIPAWSREEIRISSFNAGLSCCFAVETDSGVFLVDAGSPGQDEKIIKKVREFSGKPVRMIILTHAHFDHVGSAGKIREKLGVPIAVHYLDSLDLAEGKTRLDSVAGWGKLGKVILPLAYKIYRPPKIVPDIIIRDSLDLCKYGFPGYFLHTPGHTAGSITLILHNKAAITGDLIVSLPRIMVQCYFASGWKDLDLSLDKLKKKGPEQIYSGHSCKPIDREKLMTLKPFYLR